MIQASLADSLKLIGRSRNESAFYAAAAVAGALAYALACAALGAGPAYGPGAEEAELGLARGFVAYLPGMLISAWMLAGLAGRFTAHAGGRDAGAFAGYARERFLQAAAWEIVFSLLMWTAVIFLRLKLFLGALAALAWMAGGIWLAVRVMLWLNAAFDEGLPFPAALRRSWELTRGRSWTVLATGAVPMGCATLLGSVLDRLPLPSAAAYYAGSALEGCASVVMAGALTSLYFRIKAAGPVIEETGEGGTFWGRS